MKKNDFVIAGIPSGKLNDLVKKIIKKTGVRSPEEAVHLINSGEWSLSPVEYFTKEESDDNCDFVVADITLGKLNALVKNLLRETGIADPGKMIESVNEGRWIFLPPLRSWTEENGAIRFSLELTGITGKKWITRLSKKGYKIGEKAMSILLSDDFKPTIGTANIVILKGELFNRNIRTFDMVANEEVKKRQLSPISLEEVCAIRYKFSDKQIREMGLEFIVGMHKPIEFHYDSPKLLSIDTGGNGNYLSTLSVHFSNYHGYKSGFAFQESREESLLL